MLGVPFLACTRPPTAMRSSCTRARWTSRPRLPFKVGSQWVVELGKRLKVQGGETRAEWSRAERRSVSIITLARTHKARYAETPTLVHFGAVVADAPSPLSTPRSATGQAQPRLGRPLRMKCRASPVLLFRRAGKVVSGTVGIVRATVPFHGEHDALEPTKVGLRFSTCPPSHPLVRLCQR